MQDFFGPSLRQKGIEDTGALTAKLFLLHQDINGEHHAENKVEDGAENRSSDADRRIDKLSGIALKIVEHSCAELFPIDFEIRERRGVHLQKGCRLGDPDFDLLSIPRHIVDQEAEGPLQLRDDHKNEDE